MTALLGVLIIWAGVAVLYMRALRRAQTQNDALIERHGRPRLRRQPSRVRKLTVVVDTGDRGADLLRTLETEGRIMRIIEREGPRG